MSDLRIYQTSDPDFADRAIRGLRDAGIACYQLDQGAPTLNASIGRWTDDQISIYIEREADGRVASDILLKLGASAKQPVRLPNRRMLALVVAVLAVLVLLSVMA